MELHLTNRVALVTGSSKGIGKAIARSLLEEGAHVILCGRGEKALKEAQKEFDRFEGSVDIGVADLTDPSDVRRLFSNTVEKIGRLDILINNAGGVAKFGSFLELSVEDWQRAFDLNFMSAVYCCQCAIPWLQKSDQARIINISSVPAKQPGAFNPHYSSAKAAMLNLSKHLSNVLAKDNILVNTLCPSTLKGGGWDDNVKHKSERLNISLTESEKIMEAEEGKKNPLGRVGTLNEIAKMATFLAGSEATFVTGVCLDIDGGTVRSSS